MSTTMVLLLAPLVLAAVLTVTAPVPGTATADRAPR